MKRVIICLILVLVLATQAYGFGRRGGDARPEPVFSGGSFSGAAPAEGVVAQNSETPGQPISVPEPATLVLLGAGLVGLYGLRRKLKK